MRRKYLSQDQGKYLVRQQEAVPEANSVQMILTKLDIILLFYPKQKVFVEALT